VKLFDIDWTVALRDLRRWTALPFPARRSVLEELKPSGYVMTPRFGSSLAAIVESGLARLSVDRSRVSLPEEHRGLVKVLRAMHRHPVFDDPAPPALVKYLEEHFTQEEINAIGTPTEPRSYGGVTRQSLAARVAYAGWAGDLIAADGTRALRAWAERHGIAVDSSAIGRLGGLQSLARQLKAFPNGVPLRDLLAPLDEDQVSALGDALVVGLATLVVFAGMRAADLEPMIGLWPGTALELTRAPAPRPSPVAPAAQFTLAVQMEDMTTVLAAAVAAPVRLRADDLAVFARTRTVIEGRLVSLPAWTNSLFADARSTRVDLAARELQRVKFARLDPIDGNPHLRPTAAGAAWLSRSPRDRLAALIDPMRSSLVVNPVGSYHDGAWAPFFPFSLPYYQAPQSLDVRAALARAFLDAGEGFIGLTPFLEHAIAANPFTDLARRDPRAADQMLMGFYGEDPRESYKNLWRNVLYLFFVHRLVVLGGATVGHLSNGALCFALTDVGRYLLGAAPTFTYGDRAAAEVVIQPNFDVVFLGAAPSTEALLSRFAERVGAAPGLAFKITRASVLAAAEVGATVDDALTAFRQASSKGIPKNVEREIVGWMGGVRRARLRVVRVIECADQETADRAAALLGGKAKRLTPTMLEVPDATPAARAAGLKKLRAGGVFLEESTPSTAQRAKSGGRGRRRSYASWEDEEFPPEAEEFE